MQTKTYFASSVPAALEVARKELGEDAMLVTSKPASAEARPFGKLEVTFAFDAKKVAVPAFSPVRNAPPAARKTDLEEIREQISALRMAMGRAGNSGVPEMPRSAASAQEMAGRIPVAVFAEMKRGESRTLAFIGPPGRGKTSSLVKVAARYGIGQRVPVRIFSVGAHGVGCQEQMARYATILGVPFQAYESLDSFHLALSGDTWKGLSLIDTPGLSPSDRMEMDDLGRFFSRHSEIEKHLVLRADARSADMGYVISRFSGLGTNRLLFTGLDEAMNASAMIETLVESKVPGTWVGTGSRIPDDMEEVEPLRLARLVCGETALAAVA